MTNEKYLFPKELATVIEERFGLRLTARYITAIRRECVAKRNGVFVLNQAKPSELLEWIKKNPEFRRRPAETNYRLISLG